MFSNIRNKCIHCGGDHAPGLCPTKTRPQVAQNAAGYQTYDNNAIAGKANTNDLPFFSSKSGQPTAANMTPSSPRNSAGAQRHPSCPRETITPQVSPKLHNKTSIRAASAPTKSFPTTSLFSNSIPPTTYCTF